MIDGSFEVLRFCVVRVCVNRFIVCYCYGRDEFLFGVEMTGTVDQQHFDDDCQVIFEETSKNEGVYVLDSGQQLQNTNDILLHFYSDLLTDAAIGQS